MQDLKLKLRCTGWCAVCQAFPGGLSEDTGPRRDQSHHFMTETL